MDLFETISADIKKAMLAREKCALRHFAASRKNF